MNEFNQVLRGLDARLTRLNVAQPARSRVIIEVAADLRDMEADFVAGGADAEEARRLALERCDLSDDAVTDLARVYASAYRRFLDRLSAQARTRWERILLALACAAVVLGAGRVATSGALFAAGGVVAVLATLVAVAALVFAAVRVYAVYVAREHHPRRLRRGLYALPALAAYNVFLAVAGAWGAFYRAAWGVAEDPSRMVPLVTGWLRSVAAATVVCLLSAILIALLWYVLENKVKRIEEAEASSLLFD